MSTESARAFIARARTDKDFAQKMLGFHDDAAAESAFLGASGFDFTVEEFTEELMNHDNHISDNELHKIARSINKYLKIGQD